MAAQGATLGDKAAHKEFGPRQGEMVHAIPAGKHQYRHNAIYGNPFLRLLLVAAWHALWRPPPAMTGSEPGRMPWMLYPAVSFVAAVRPLR